jgi:hypothetical protein
MTDALEFYVVPMSATRADTWLIFMGSLSRCVGVYANSEDAITHAVIKAQYQVASGTAACVRLWGKERLRWSTVWPQAHSPA